MLAVDFPERNMILAENQPEYEPMPVFCQMMDVLHKTNQYLKIDEVSEVIRSYVTGQISIGKAVEILNEQIKKLLPNIPDTGDVMFKKTVPWAMTACFQLNKEEIDEMVKTGKVWYTQMLFGNNFQPVLLSTENPFK